MYRKILLVLGLLFSFSLFSMASRLEPYSSSRIFWDTASRSIIFQSGGYARVIQLKDHRLMAVAENNGINIAFSNNMGRTWTSLIKITNNPNKISECTPDLIQLKDGTIIVAYNPRPSEPYTEDRKFGIRCKISTDNGVNWSNEIFVNDASHLFADGCWEPSLLELPSGEVQIYFADEGSYTDSGEQQISMCRSFDSGKTWGSAQKVAFRSNARDGMPSAILLHDQNTIALAFEDSGWSGIGDFIPTIGTCPLSINWSNYWIDATNQKRWKAIDYTYCPKALGGAPYLRVLPWGETMLSHQSAYGTGKSQMWVYVGDDKARNFKAMSSPFSLGRNDYALWNSLAVVDTGIVIAVSAINDRTEMIKGYPVRQLEAPYGHPVIDGKQTGGEGYLKPNATQMILGRQQGTRFTSDFAYDEDSLYFTSRVSDTTPNSSHGSYSDGISLFLDLNYASDEYPVNGMRRFFFCRNKKYQTWHGDNTKLKWIRNELSGVHMEVKTTNNHYIIEAAIPWNAIGIAPTNGKLMRANVMLQDYRNDSSFVTEMLPDAKRDASWSWMDFTLLNKQTSNYIETIPCNKIQDNTIVKIKDKDIEVKSHLKISHIAAFNPEGKLICQSNKHHIPIGTYTGPAIINIDFIDGTTINKKILIKR